ncbi:NAD(P)-binding protein [Coccomyxa subellipsoidea C-169]|uniref:NAD(P)-binding protein n=1 Tax=Coccomyxa subellipsoidea (strain C-169) TaxID=574566 RepID=I0Z2F1_COCSC|nr:NAD(P)-binding protein [Coccomyxa subellipsoidea C-169]EIE24820.1 NAD(P)-binding protein [Coccomyxa subellipsoidea C-169]|eukprot:XP_005649364.1 NAD(P)-binding protein [Coccomyxa subellipsoidea C-169]
MISLAGIAWSIVGFIFLSYLIPHFVVTFLKPKDLKKAYNAKWGLVTGASSGIGKSLATRLADQGLNVVVVALQDGLLDATFSELQAQFPKQTFRKVGVNLGKTGYLEKIAEATADIDVQILFCNAGYMLTGFFENTPLEQQMANLECNAVCAVAITHHFLAKMVAKKLKGCIVFTSSAAASIASPFTALYAATKSFVSSFGASLAVEVRHHGIDVLVFHPSPVNTRFYDKAHKLDVLDFFKAQAVHPDALPDAVFRCIGRTVWADIGTTALCFRLAMKLMDYNLMATITALMAPLLPDFKKAMKAKKAN